MMVSIVIIMTFIFISSSLLMLAFVAFLLVLVDF